MVGWGIRQDRGFSGDLSDELYGFFVLDMSLPRIIKALRIVTAPRWLDSRFRVQEITAETIIVSSQRETVAACDRRGSLARETTYGGPL
jgi:hypothetical protein